MPTVIVHCWSMASDPRRFLGAYSAIYAVAIAECGVRHDRPGGVDTCVGDQQFLAAEPVRGQADQDRPGCAAGRGARRQVSLG